MSHQLEEDKAGRACSALEVTRGRGVPSIRGGGRGGACWGAPGLSTGWGAHSSDRPQGAVGRHHWGSEPVTHPSCLSLLEGVWGVSSPVTKGRALTVTPTPTPQGSSLETWHPAGGWSCGGVCPPPPKCQCPEGSA